MAAGDPSSASTARRYGGLTAQERLDRRRAQFLDAGLEIFGTTGYRTATAREVCRLAGLTDRYFHESFESMEDLLVAVYHAGIARLRDAVLQAFVETADKGLAVATRAMLDAHFTFARDRRTARVIWHEVLGVSPRVDAVYGAVLEEFADFMYGVVVGSPQTAPVLEIVTPEELKVITTSIVGSLDQYTRIWMVHDYTPAQEVVVSGLSRVLLALTEAADGSSRHESPPGAGGAPSS